MSTETAEASIEIVQNSTLCKLHDYKFFVLTCWHRFVSRLKFQGNKNEWGRTDFVLFLLCRFYLIPCSPERIAEWTLPLERHRGTFQLYRTRSSSWKGGI